MNTNVSKSIPPLSDKWYEKIIEGVKKVSKKQFEKFKIDFHFAFSEYLDNSFKKYSQVKTLLYNKQPRYLYDFFESPNLQIDDKIYREREEDCDGNRINSNDVRSILDISHFLLIRGSGGLGKSTLFKHIFVQAYIHEPLIPVFIELKELNNYPNDYELNRFVFKQLYCLKSTLNSDYLEYALSSDRFLFLFDGYDELSINKREEFRNKLRDFCDRYPNNFFIVSSRPCQDLEDIWAFQRFTVIDICPLTKSQAISLIKKLEYEETIKDKFVNKLEESLFERYKSFASNPLLLNIMLLTYKDYADIPAKIHAFYEAAFQTMYWKHDATKEVYKRDYICGLSYDDFKTVFSYFCFITYYKNKFEFSKNEMVRFLEYIQKQLPHIVFNVDDYIKDLIEALCMIYCDGYDTYIFTHRSFQEYFTAVYIKELSDDEMKRLIDNMVQQTNSQLFRDNVVSMLFDMTRKRVVMNIIIPWLSKIEKDYVSGDIFNFYIRIFQPQVSYFDNKISFFGISIKNVYVEKLVELIDNMSLWDQPPTITSSEFLTFMRENPSIVTVVDYENSNHYGIMDFFDTVAQKEYVIDFDQLLNDSQAVEMFRGTIHGQHIDKFVRFRDYVLSIQKEIGSVRDYAELLNL